MGATAIATVACPKALWTLIADGAVYASIGVQAAGAQPLAIAVAGTLPAPGLTDYITLGVGDPSVVIPLTTAGKIYGRGYAGDATARFYGVGI